jgi:hypothetical protein
MAAEKQPDPNLTVSGLPLCLCASVVVPFLTADAERGPFSA